MKKHLCLLFWAFPVLLCGQTRYFINTSATGANTGTSWADAFTDLQSALQQANAGDEIWVATGIYKPTAGTDRAISFEPASGVQVYGGFHGTETSLSERDWTLYPTVLSGDIGVQGDSTDNSYNVLYLFEPDSNTVLDGFVIEGGNASNGGGQSFSFQRQFNGGGLHIMCFNGDAYAIIKHCKFSRNAAQANGGAIMVYGGGPGSVNSVLIKDCIFEQNRALFYGGGVYRTGGGMLERGAKIEGCRFVQNQAFTGGGLSWLDNAGMDSIVIRGCYFSQNTAVNWGGSAYLSPERITPTFVLVDSCQFLGNKSKYGAGLDIFPINSIPFTGSNRISRSYFSQNEITANTGEYIIRVTVFGAEDSQVIVDSCEVLDNFLLLGGVRNIELNNGYGNIYVLKSIVRGDWGLLSVGDSPNAIIDRSIFFRNSQNNTAFNDGVTNSFILKNSMIIDKNYMLEGIAPIGRRSHFQSVENCFFRIVTEPLVFKGTSGPPVYCTNSVFFNVDATPNFSNAQNHVLVNCYTTSIDCNNPPNPITCINSFTGFDPQFINPDSNDYRLSPCSPLVNAGVNSVIEPGDTDLDGYPRIRGGGVDIGPYESAPMSLATPPEVLPACADTANGGVTITAAAACAPLAYSWSGPDGSAGNSLEQLAPGDYSITLTDAKHDTVLLTLSVPQREAPQLQSQTTPVFCGTTMGGTATLTGTGTAGPYHFTWPDGSIDSMLLDLAYGTYPVTVTDVYGCSSPGQVQIGRMGSLAITITENPISCHNGSDGAILVAPQNGAAPYTWYWESFPNTEPNLLLLPAGTYAGTMTDALGCAVNWIVPIENPDSIMVNYETTMATGPNESNGNITLLPVGGTGSFGAEWSHGASGLSVAGLLPGYYTATVTDANGCAEVLTIEVTWSSGTEGLEAGAFAVWPNPVSDYLQVRLPQDRNGQAYEFRIADGAGRVLRTYIIREDGPVWVGDLPAGGYFWRVMGERNTGGGVIIKL